MRSLVHFHSVGTFQVALSLQFFGNLAQILGPLQAISRRSILDWTQKMVVKECQDGRHGQAPVDRVFLFKIVARASDNQQTNRATGSPQLTGEMLRLLSWNYGVLGPMN